MIHQLKNTPKAKYWDYFILVARFLLGWTFLRYGYSKLNSGQFGVSEEELLTPLKDLSLFRVSWYLFDHQPLKIVVGVMQIICSSLLIINRTAIIGALMFIPIISIILLIDLTAMPYALKVGFAWRLSFYILLDLLILWHYREKMEVIGEAVWQNVNTKFSYSLRMYALLPIMAIVLEVTGVMPKILINLITDPIGMIKAFEKFSAYTIEKLL
ncbi:DoxX family membrane protein [Tunicatimonas pelagia]|uniref:DoxX family membrane protein n=1 Tax=Tunicatimonas pelagia TaxID=931531 RepID=UPI00266627EE|nr:DoxX family membrane protein [Tunicatimonas pelagia]WKN44013.1 DoxX family membrane protein [Tunicatimonas pelagia]